MRSTTRRQQWQRNQKNWDNVFCVRQEYNEYQKKWFPIILYWNGCFPKVHIEALCTETGSSFYYTELKSNFADVTRKGTDKCDPDDVKRIREYFNHDYASAKMYEVQKLGAYCPVV